jgi:hypothetical protein
VPFRPLAPDLLQEILLADGIAEDQKLAARLAEASEGSIARARELADPERLRLWLRPPPLTSTFLRILRTAWPRHPAAGPLIFLGRTVLGLLLLAAARLILRATLEQAQTSLSKRTASI